MIDFAVKYQLCYFLNLLDYQPTPKLIAEIITKFCEDDFLPATFDEIGPNGPMTRLKLVSRSKNIQIGFELGRVNIIKINENMPNDIAAPREFIDTVSGLIDKIEIIQKKQASRLAWVSHYVCSEMNEDKMRGIQEKLSNAINFYKEHPVNEWDIRLSSRISKEINGKTELFNSITQISRNQSIFQSPKTTLSFERINLLFDINTFQGNTNTRFDKVDFIDFSKNALNIESEIYHQIESLSNE